MNDVKDKIRQLRTRSKIAYLGSINQEGYPQIKGMLVLETDSMKIQYFSTNNSSRRAAQFRANPHASVYYCDESTFEGAQFTGTLEVCTDHQSKAELWREGFEMYYPEGVDDDDYCVFKFTAESVNYYHNLGNVSFDIEEL